MSLPENKETFSQRVKRELSRVKYGRSEQLALLSALFKQNAELTLGNQRSLSLSLKSGPTTQAVFGMLRSIYDPVVHMNADDGTQRKSYRLYGLSITTKIDEVMNGLCLGRDVPSKSLLPNKATKRAYLIGAFLGGGYVSEPGARTPNLEITSANDRMAQLLIALFAEWGFAFQYRMRSGTAVCYLRRAEHIVDALKLLGANQAMMEFEDVRIRLDLSRQLTRVVNIDIANQQRTLRASDKLIADIALLEKRGVLVGLSPKARAFCKIRTANRSMSLEGIAELMVKKGTPITRSGLHHYSRHITRLAKAHGKNPKPNI